MDKTKIAFFGSARYSLPFLDFLHNSELTELALMVSQPDKPTGRGFEVKPSPAKEWAKKHRILTLTPTDLTEPLFLGTLKTLPLKLGVICYYGVKIPKEVIDFFPFGILNIHHSLLPKHRGSNPIPWAILKGDTKTGTTIIKINERFDRGEILAQAEEEIKNDDTTESLRARLDQKALELLSQILPGYLDGKIKLKEPDLNEGSYEPKLTKDSGRIDWNQSDEEIERAVRAFTPWPGAWTTLDELGSSRIFNSQFSIFKEKKGKRVKILKAHLDENKKLVIDTLQIEGKTPVDLKQFLSGHH